MVRRISRRWVLVVERPGAMHGAAIVPDHEIMRPPDVAVDELPLRGVVHQVAQQQPALRHLPVDDMLGVRGEIEARGGRRSEHGAHQRMDGALQLVLLVLVEVEAQHVARIDDGMIDAQPFDRGAGFPRRAHRRRRACRRTRYRPAPSGTTRADSIE